MAYLKVRDLDKYIKTIYSGETDNKLKLIFNGEELQDADILCEKVTIKSRIIPNGSKRFGLNSFISKEVELILHNIDEEILQSPVELSIGTFVEDDYDFVPIGVFNISEKPKNDKDKITLTLRDLSTNLDYNYNAQPLIEEHGGKITKKQLLDDICLKSNIQSRVTSFRGDTEEIGVYDSTITARNQIAFIAEQAGAIPVMDREGYLVFTYTEKDFAEIADVDLEIFDNIGEKATKFKIYGASEQETREGYNLIEYNDSFKIGSVASGITPTINEDGTLKVVTTSGNSNWHTNWWDSNQTFGKIENQLNDGDTFTISFTIKKLSGSKGIPRIYIKAGMGYYDMEGNITTEYSEIYYTGKWNKTSGYISIHLGWGTTEGTFIIKNWQIKKGEYKPYEPYGAMPSPDYPSEIKTIGIKNLLKNSSFHNNLEEWEVRDNNNQIEITEKFGYNCLKIEGKFNETAYVRQQINERIKNDKIYTVTCKAYLENYKKGTTNLLLQLYTDGKNKDGSWAGRIDIQGNSYFNSYSYKNGFLNFTYSFKLSPNVNLSKPYYLYIYARDFTGNLYIYDMQLEEGVKGNKFTEYNKLRLDNNLNLIKKDGYSTPISDTDYWQSALSTTPLEDGWCKIEKNNTSSSQVYINNYLNTNAIDYEPNQEYTILFEWRKRKGYNSCNLSQASADINPFTTNAYADMTKENGIARHFLTTKDYLLPNYYGLRVFFTLPANTEGYIETRVTIIKGHYTEQLTEYTSYRDDVTFIDLGNRELSQVDDVRDELEVVSGKGIQRIRHLQLKISDMNNSEDYPGWKRISQLLNDIPNANDKISLYTNYKCNIYLKQNNLSKELIGINTVNGVGTIYLSKSVINLTQTQWKQMYPDLVLDLYYVLLEEQPFEIEPVNLKLYENYNKIKLVSDIDTILEMDYEKPKHVFELPFELVEKYESAKTYEISKVQYDDAIRLYESGNDVADILYIDTSNPYISSQEQISEIYQVTNGFRTDSVKTGKIIGNPLIDPYDFVKFYDDEKEKDFKFLATNNLTYNGVMINTFDNIIGEEEREINITKTGEAAYKKYVQTSIDNVNAEINMVVGRQDEQQEEIVKVNQSINGIQNLFQITGGANLIKNSVGLFGKDYWIVSEGGTQEFGELNELIGKTTSNSRIKLSNCVIQTAENNITGLILEQIKSLSFKIQQDEDVTTTITLYSLSIDHPLYQKTFTGKYDLQEIYDDTENRFEVDSSNLTLLIETSSVYNGSFMITDLMLNDGDKSTWQPAAGEIWGTVIKMSQLGISCYSRDGGYVTLMASQGIQVRELHGDEVGDIITDFTNLGLETKDIIQKGQSKHVQKKLVHGIMNVNNNEVYVEYIRSDE